MYMCYHDDNDFVGGVEDRRRRRRRVIVCKCREVNVGGVGDREPDNGCHCHKCCRRREEAARRDCCDY
ncbi:hypothetical protein J14TS2_01070 [Bacillus sp. J14TS2]|nr:hypothetical protein J14TS2_01070 [Bacillus sp. J14TS2]